MKNLLALLFIGMIVISCGSTKELEEVEEEAATPELVEPKPQEVGKPMRRKGVDIDKIIAQLGLTEAQEEEFLLMWNTTEEKMQQVRREFAGQRDLLLPNLRAIKNERFDAIDRIFTPDQLKRYRELMQSNRNKNQPFQRREGGK